jgi:Acetyl-CoA dehydrogenase C-terminal like
MAHAARIARDLLSAGEENTAFLHAKIATARFYAEHAASRQRPLFCNADRRSA